jgi:hypothetical protein
VGYIAIAGSELGALELLRYRVLRQKMRSYVLQLSTTACRMPAAVHCLLLNKVVNKRTADARFVAACIRLDLHPFS